MSNHKILLQRRDSLPLFLEEVGGMWTMYHCDTVAPSQTFPDDCCTPNDVEMPYFSCILVSAVYGAPDMTLDVVVGKNSNIISFLFEIMKYKQAFTINNNTTHRRINLRH